ncbi:MAG: DUF1540 domain-containing protein [Anaeroplasmataceae bacterium]
MSEIKCNATACGYNKERFCNKKVIKVEGLFSRSKLGTFCHSFKNTMLENITREEIAEDMYDSIATEPMEVMISCSANYCVYNKNDYCQAKEIKVGGSNAKYRSETECDSFKLR